MSHLGMQEKPRLEERFQEAKCGHAQQLVRSASTQEQEDATQEQEEAAISNARAEQEARSK